MKCKAILNNGKHCKHKAYLDGYCIMHYRFERYREKYGKTKQD